MSTALVTGASGFIGARLVQELAGRGQTVHALMRRDPPPPPPGFACGDGPDFRHRNVRVVQGDITDRDSLRRAMTGCSQVYHLAGYAKNWARDPQTYFAINRDGLRNVLEAAALAGVERIVWTSTMLTFGPTRAGEVGDEEMPRTTPNHVTQYEASKAAAEMVAAEYAARGLPIVIVNPGRVFGPGYLNEGNALSMIIDMYDRGRAPVLLGARKVANYVYVDDVVSGLIAAMERSRVGEKYILGGENLSLKDFFRSIDRVTGKRHFQVTIRRPAAMAYAGFQKARAVCFGIHPQVTPEWIRVFLTDWAYSSAKAQRELGYQITPIEEAIRRTHHWLLRIRESAS